MKKLKAFRKSPGKLAVPVHLFLLPVAVACAFATSNVHASEPAKEFWQSQGFSEILSYSNDDDFDINLDYIYYTKFSIGRRKYPPVHI